MESKSGSLADLHVPTWCGQKSLYLPKDDFWPGYWRTSPVAECTAMVISVKRYTSRDPCTLQPVVKARGSAQFASYSSCTTTGCNAAKLGKDSLGISVILARDTSVCCYQQ